MTDVNAVLAAASAELELGELLQADNFDLHTTISAVEIGEPRIDAGIPQKSVVDIIHPKDLTLQQLLAIMDELMAAEATWFRGDPSVQTIYTCHYLVDAEGVENVPVLDAVCIAVQVTTRIISNMAFDTRVCLEEDFLPHLFGLNSSKGLGDVPKALAALELAEEQISALHVQSSEAADKISRNITAALMDRLRFRKLLLQLLGKLANGKELQGDIVHDLLTQTLETLVKMEASQSVAAEPAPGFNPNLSRHLLGPTLPRKVALLPRPEAFAIVRRILRQLFTICDLIEVNQWHSLKRFMRKFAASQAESVVRLVVGTCLGRASPGGGAPYLPDKAMMAAALALPDACSVPNGSPLQNFICQAADMRRRHRRATEDWHRLLTLAHAVEALPDFQKDMEPYGWSWPPSPESRLAEMGPLSTWVEMECASDQLQHLLLGFELSCYLPHEFSMVYWYCDYLYGVLLETSSALAHTFPVPSPEQKILAAAGGKPKGKKGKRKGEPRDSQAQKQNFAEALTNLADQAKLAAKERQMCQGVMRVAAGLGVGGLIPPRPSPFNSEEQAFEQRFFAFTHAAAPAALSHQDYSQAMDLSGCSMVDLLTSAKRNFELVLLSRNFTPAEDDSEEKAGAVEMVAKRNLVAVNLLLSLENKKQRDKEEELSGTRERNGENDNEHDEKKGSSLWQVSWDFSHHKFYPVLSLKVLK